MVSILDLLHEKFEKQFLPRRKNLKKEKCTMIRTPTQPEGTVKSPLLITLSYVNTYQC